MADPEPPQKASVRATPDSTKPAASRRAPRVVLGLAVLLAIGLAGAWWSSRYLERRHWARRIDVAGLNNAHRVSKDLYRGEKPTPESLAELKRMGVRTVIDLAGFPDEREAAESAGLDYVLIRAGGLRASEDAVVEFLRTVARTERGPFFVHCHMGVYRTGVMVAAYRMFIEGRSIDAAVREVSDSRYGFAPENADVLADHLRKLDPEKLKKAAGLSD